MKPFFKLLYLFAGLFVNNCMAQIPYATQQPKWYMAVYARDATGVRDTVYVGEDPTARQGNYFNLTYDDLNFGEKWIIPQNPSEFSMSTYHWIQIRDSMLKVDINNYTVSNQLYYNVDFDSVTFPITITWDLAKLRSDSLPFPFQGLNIPEAQIELSYPGGQMFITYPVMSCNQNLPIIISDTIKSNCYCYTKDSLVISDFFGNTGKQAAGISFEIKAWTGQTPLGIKDYEVNNWIIAPNPFTEEIKISASKTFYSPIHVIIFNSMGTEVKHNKISQDNSFISTVGLVSGVYFIKLMNEKEELLSIKKIIKL